MLLAVCSTTDVCPSQQLPDGKQQQPAACTSDSMMPNSYELDHGKTFSCMCGGLPGDASTQWACKQQPLTYWQFNMQPQDQGNGSQLVSAASGKQSQLFPSPLTMQAKEPQAAKVDFHVVERGGIMSNDVNWHKFQYAYAGVWQGNITGCTFSIGPCTRPLEGDDCFVATCSGSQVVCPPPCKSLLCILQPLSCQPLGHAPCTHSDLDRVHKAAWQVHRVARHILYVIALYCHVICVL